MRSTILHIFSRTRSSCVSYGPVISKGLGRPYSVSPLLERCSSRAEGDKKSAWTLTGFVTNRGFVNGGARYFSSKTSSPSSVELVYDAPFKSAVRTIKVVSLTTAVGSLFGSPVLIWMGNTTVPVTARVMMSVIVMILGFGNTMFFHWLLKGYVIKMEYNREKDELTAYTVSLLARLVKYPFQVSEASRPAKATEFKTFQAKGKGFYITTDNFTDKQLLSRLLGASTVTDNSNSATTPAVKN